jgi:hypothetical protein
VRDASAIFVAITHLRLPGGAASNTLEYISLGRAE